MASVEWSSTNKISRKGTAHAVIWETSGAIAASIGEIVRFGLPEDYFKSYPDKVRALTDADLAQAAKEVVHPDQLIWVIVGDRSKIEPGLRELGWGEIHLLTADGATVSATR